MKKLFIIGLLFNTLCSYATVYFVDKTAGLDSNSGKSKEAPWQSFSNIYSKRLTFVPGDTIFLKGGEIWNEFLNLQLTGSSTAPIVVAGYGTGRPCVRGVANALQAVDMLNCSYTEVNDIEIDGSQLGTVAVCGLSITASSGQTLKGLKVRNLYIHDVIGTHVKANGGGAGIIVKRLATNSLFDGLLIENNLIRRCSRNGINFSTGYSGRNVWQPNLNVVIRGNVLEQVPGDGIVPIACNKALVEYNVMRDCTPLLLGEAAAGIWPWGSDSTIIQYNEVSGHRAYWDGQGFDADYNCIGTVIQYNYSHDNDGGFLLVCCDGSSLGKNYNIGTIGTIIRFNVSINGGIRDEKTQAGTYFSPVFHITGPTDNTQIYN
ncbi:MAG: right-handed parallel beta-helix repeat-containing protein, partial [Bacteroidia bacterium]|nr:right-handed parallel beta-helix repeat-containing protein [Bacteroidia bacterium]